MKRIISVLLAVLTVVGVVLSMAAATSGNVEKSLLYDDVKITLNGSEIKPCDVNGNYIEPFIIEGTTYLPVRGIANALGLNVGWDEATSTVKLNEPTLEKNELYSGYSFKLIADKYSYNAEGDLVLKFRLENKNIDDMWLEMKSISVNGFMLEGGCEEYIESGKKKTVEITLPAQQLKDNGISYVREVELCASVTSAQATSTLIENGVITITPDSASLTEKKTYEAQKYDFEYEDFVEFIKQNGEQDEKSYSLDYAFFVNDDPEEDRAKLVYFELKYDGKDKKIFMDITLCEWQLGRKNVSFVTLTIPKNAEKYSFEAFLPSYGNELTTNGTFDAVTGEHKSDNVEVEKITVKDPRGYYENSRDGIQKTLIATVISDVLNYISEYGDGIFTENGSELTFKYFGI